jgi:hypothetical protein
MLVAQWRLLALAASIRPFCDCRHCAARECQYGGMCIPKMVRCMLANVEGYLALATTCEQLAQKTPDPYSKHVLGRSARDFHDSRAGTSETGREQMSGLRRWHRRHDQVGGYDGSTFV